MAKATSFRAFQGCTFSAASVKRCRPRRVLCPQASQVNWDPEGLLGTPQTGHIARRMMQKQMEQNKQLALDVQMTTNQARKELLVKREARRQPTTHAELIEYLLNTEAADMEYEIARCRPMLTKEFFAAMDRIVGQERFSAKPDEDRLAELDTLRKYLDEAVEAVDKAATMTATAAERLKKLLTSKDKKECILQMAADNEIDQGLVDLLQQNITAARAAGQEEPAKFMEKVLVATVKYLIKV